MREQGSGTLEVIEHALKPLKIKMSELIVEMQLGSTVVKILSNSLASIAIEKN
jgi:hypothetical protein